MSGPDLLLSFYGDDFTGSTDSMEVLARAGIPTILFLHPPAADQFTGDLAGVRAVGVAGIARSLGTAEMEAEITPVLQALKKLNAPLFHYKICSTLDSSPETGSIGKAIELALRVFPTDRIPLLPGAPFLKRYVAFGNLFATVNNVTHRLDRHPTMSRHPVTPMDEADVRRHLARQTDLPIDLVDWRALERGQSSLFTEYDRLPTTPQPRLVLFDTMRDADLQQIGRVLWEKRPAAPGLVVGSSGVEAALAAAWSDTGLIRARPAAPGLPEVPGMIAVSGSASPQTREQIETAIQSGWWGLRLDPVKLCSDEAELEIRRLAARSVEKIRNGQSVILYSVLGPDDPAILPIPGTGARLGRLQGRLLRIILEQTGLRRALVAGGDTSGHAARELGIYALELAAPAVPGGPICRARSEQALFNGLEIVLKGGQVGPPDFFETVRRGGLPANPET